MAKGNSRRLGYTLNLFSNPGGINPVDNTTYFIGYTNSTTEGVRVYIPKSGIIKRCYVNFIAGVVGSNEQSSISIRVNNTTDTLISNGVTNNAMVAAVNNTSLNIPVSEGDYIELKWVTPTWATNPTAVALGSTIYIE